MSHSDKGDRGALVALALVTSAVVIIFLFDRLGYSANEVIESAAQPNGPKENSQGQAVQSVYWGLFTARDTFAQWIAAFATIGSVMVSIWAVLFLRRTLQETQETNRIQTDALKWQRRAISASEGPSLVASNFKVNFTAQRGFECSIQVKNEGKNTAFVKGISIYQNIAKNTPENIPFVDTNEDAGTLGVGFSLHIDSDPKRPPPHKIDQRLFDAINHKKINYYFCCRVTYADLFGTTFEWVFIGKVEPELVDGGVRFRLVVPTATSGITYLREKEDEKSKT